MTKRHIIILISFLLTLCGAKVSAQNEFLLTGKVMDNDMNPVELASAHDIAVPITNRNSVNIVLILFTILFIVYVNTYKYKVITIPNQK
jgi:hypothetical protein